VLPEAVRGLFSDVDLSTFEPTKYPKYTIERVLELGDELAVAWMRGLFPPATITQVLRTSRHLTPRSANFWGLIFDVPRDEIAVLGSKPGSNHS
jgi:hypothetical protein